MGGICVNNDVIDFFDRKDELYTSFNDPNTAKFPRKYQEISSYIFSDQLKKDLFIWWDMDLSNSPPYVVNNSNTPIKQLKLSGSYTGAIETNTSNEINFYSYITQQSKEYLPFGGFPGTDRYGRE